MSQVLVPIMIMALSIYFYTYSIVCKSIILIVIIIAIFSVYNLIRVDYLYLQPLIITLK